MHLWQPYQLGLWRARLSPSCQVCHDNPKSIGYLCDGCHDDSDWLPQPFDVQLDEGRMLTIQHASSYTNVMAYAISQFKDKENLATLPYLHTALTQLVTILPDEAVILPVPTTNSRLVERGFYPVGFLANYLSHLSGLPIYNGVVRSVDGVHQRSLGRIDRLHNLDGAFEVIDEPASPTIIIFDDVVTTGSTLKSIADTLYCTFGDEIIVGGVCLAHGRRN